MARMPVERITFAPSDISGRLRFAREKAGYETAADATEARGWTYSTYASHENGSRGIPRDKIRLYARAFKVNPLWLLTGEGNPDVPRYAGIIGRIGAGACIISVDGAQDLGEVQIPAALDDNEEELVGFEVDGDIMYPAFRDGDRVFAGAATSDISDSIGRECIIQINGGECYLKTLENGSKQGFFNLVSYNFPPIRDVQIDWVRPVLFIKRA